MFLASGLKAEESDQIYRNRCPVIKQSFQAKLTDLSSLTSYIDEQDEEDEDGSDLDSEDERIRRQEEMEAEADDDPELGAGDQG